MRNWFARPLTIRAALLVGFGLTLGLWLFAGYQVTLRIYDAQRNTLAASARYQQAQELLAVVRSQVLVASVLVRDALLDPDPALFEIHRKEIEQAYDSIDDQLSRYVPFLGSVAERERVDRLRSEVQQLRFASEDVLATDRTRWSADARLLLQRFMPRREAAIRVSEEVQSLNRAVFIEQQRAITDSQASLQRQVLTVLGVALAISLAIGGLAFRHAVRLELRLTEQHAREERIAGDLQRLSARSIHIQEDEQRRIARELHDAVGQALSSVKLELAVAQRKLDRIPAASNLLRDALASADLALRSVRDLSHLLHPSALEDLGLVAALGSHLAEFRKHHDVTVMSTYDGMESRLSAETERAVYRIVQEAFSNIDRHAQARVARLRLSADASVIRVVVEDDGVGFDAARAEQPGRRPGLGLLGMRERAAQLGGTVKIESRPGGGTRIEVELPGRAETERIDDTSEYVTGPTLVTRNNEVGHG
jgi:two-component system sensor histidine kinase UhpB